MEIETPPRQPLSTNRTETARTPWILSTSYATPAELGRRVRSVRERLGLSLRDIQIRTGVSAMTISRVENGQGSGIALGAFLRLCDALETPPGEFLRVRHQG